ncbi:EPIDERMAL PATTERNING FACTOR-like protein 4, partial [Carica papaya]|uniref:EPIDERMAL PATTERNING FACTOR-like protein 4 n=1 Tax=Carica papaya TaxID=3649 RepID=UPI000B8CE748
SLPPSLYVSFDLRLFLTPCNNNTLPPYLSIFSFYYSFPINILHINSANVRASSLAMGVVRHRLSTLIALTCLFFGLASASSITLSQLDTRFQQKEESETGGGSTWLKRVLTDRKLGGPGSSPPSCRSKCGRCCPCNPVHVPIQPGFSTLQEYYPEAWRCKCGDKLFMP